MADPAETPAPEPAPPAPNPIPEVGDKPTLAATPAFEGTTEYDRVTLSIEKLLTEIRDHLAAIRERPTFEEDSIPPIPNPPAPPAKPDVSDPGIPLPPDPNTPPPATVAPAPPAPTAPGEVFCPKCGMKYLAGTAFCSKDGTQIPAVQTPKEVLPPGIHRGDDGKLYRVIETRVPGGWASSIVKIEE